MFVLLQIGALSMSPDYRLGIRLNAKLNNGKSPLFATTLSDEVLQLLLFEVRIT